jgi:hypothetical protein
MKASQRQRKHRCPQVESLEQRVSLSLARGRYGDFIELDRPSRQIEKQQEPPPPRFSIPTPDWITGEPTQPREPWTPTIYPIRVLNPFSIPVLPPPVNLGNPAPPAQFTLLPQSNLPPEWNHYLRFRADTAGYGPYDVGFRSTVTHIGPNDRIEIGFGGSYSYQPLVDWRAEGFFSIRF